MRICICATQIPFSRGGAEIHVESLHRELKRRGHEVDIVTVPFAWHSRLQLLKSAFAWRLLDLHSTTGERPDLVIATKFPSYLIDHPNKVVWLIHQFRQAYDLKGTPYSDFGDGPEDQAALAMIRRMDNRALGEARALFTNAGNTAARLRRFNALEATPLHVPPPLDGSYRAGPFGDYVLSVGRLDSLKRFELLVDAMRHVDEGVRCRIAGTGPESENLARRIAEAGLGDRVELLGWVDDEDLLDLYAGCLAVFYAPFDEDYGYVTVEAFKSGKPVLAATDSGGVLEFVEDGRTGFVCPPDAPRAFAVKIDELAADRELARRLGEAGNARVKDITWDRAIAALTAETP
jgi:glycosyltransferase involved in cell wall biosynthesis